MLLTRIFSFSNVFQNKFHYLNQFIICHAQVLYDLCLATMTIASTFVILLPAARTHADISDIQQLMSYNGYKPDDEIIIIMIIIIIIIIIIKIKMIVPYFTSLKVAVSWGILVPAARRVTLLYLLGLFYLSTLVSGIHTIHRFYMEICRYQLKVPIAAN